MRLVGKPGGEGDSGGRFAIEQQLARKPYTTIDQKGMRRQAGLLFECSDQMRAGRPAMPASVAKSTFWLAFAARYSFATDTARFSRAVLSGAEIRL
jgi:hypothetical protein